MLVSLRRGPSSGSVFELLDDVDDALFLAGVGLGRWPRRCALGDGDHGRCTSLDAEQVAQVVQAGRLFGSPMATVSTLSL